jgi:dipeptidyl aminopeptidase/acylaminoacyl peptidase
MRTVFAFVAALLLVAHAAPSPAAVAGGAATVSQFLKVRTPAAPSLLPDGSLLLRDWPDGIFQLYRVTPKDEGGSPSYRPGDATWTRLTDYPDGLSSYTVSRDGRWVVLGHARGGNENTQLSLMDLTAGPGARTLPVVDDPKVQAAVNVWLRDDSGFIYSANAGSPNDFWLYRYDIASGRTTKVMGEQGAWSVSDVTADARRALVGHYVSASDVRLYELDLASGKRTDLTLRPEGGTAAGEFVGYMPGEREVLFLSDARDGMMRMYLRDLRKGTVKEAVPALGRFELDGAAMNDGRTLLVVVANEDGYGVPHAYTLPRLEEIPAPAMERGVLSASEFRGNTLVWSLNNPRTPGASFASSFAVATKGSDAAPPATRQLTFTEDQGLDLGAMALPKLVRYPSFDGREIPAFLYLPAGHTAGTPVPFVIVYHGGPEDQSRPTFNPYMQYLVSRGFGVMLPNVRGSTGYGREFHMLDDYRKRWDSVRDGVEAAEWLVREGYAKPGRIAAYGGSYGGFMSVACIVEDQERVDAGRRAQRLFGACVDIVGIVNLQTFLERTSGYRRKLREVEYGPLTDPEFLRSVSSIHRVDKIQVPVFIAHGFNDPRVPVEEAMQLAAALREKGRAPRMFVAPDEGHGFAKLDNRIYFGERMVQFLKETVGRDEAVGARTE